MGKKLPLCSSELSKALQPAVDAVASGLFVPCSHPVLALQPSISIS